MYGLQTEVNINISPITASIFQIGLAVERITTTQPARGSILHVENGKIDTFTVEINI